MDSPALMSFGFTAREARWLEHVLLHAGVFLRRQYLAFIGPRTRGAVDQGFLTHLRASRHVTIVPYHRRELVYHLTGKPLYERVGHPDLRHRRPLPPHRLAQKLMLLDFTLLERDHYWLATEPDKVRFFLDRGLAIDTLPRRVYQSSVDRADETTRYFVDRFPILVTSEGRVGFVFPDFSGDPDRFRTFLDEHLALLEVLPAAEVVYVTGVTGTAERAETQFRKRCGRTAQAIDVTLLDDLLEYFATRDALDHHDYGQLTKRGLERLAGQRRRFARPEYEGLHDAWASGGPVGLGAALRTFAGNPQPLQAPVTFRHVALPHRYYCLGRDAVLRGGSAGQPSIRTDQRKRGRETTG